MSVKCFRKVTIILNIYFSQRSITLFHSLTTELRPSKLSYVFKEFLQSVNYNNGLSFREFYLFKILRILNR